MGCQVSKSCDLLQLEASQNKLFQEIERLEKAKQAVLKKIEEQKDQMIQYGLLSVVLGMADETLDKAYKNNEINVEKYLSNRIFQDLLGEELKKEMKNLEGFEKHQNLEDVLSLLNKKQSEILKDYNSNKEELEALTAEYVEMQKKESMKIFTMSSIPADFFCSFKKIRSIILPNNTIVISEKSLPGNAIIKMNKENIKIRSNIYY